HTATRFIAAAHGGSWPSRDPSAPPLEGRLTEVPADEEYSRHAAKVMPTFYRSLRYYGAGPTHICFLPARFNTTVRTPPPPDGVGLVIVSMSPEIANRRL